MRSASSAGRRVELVRVGQRPARQVVGPVAVQSESFGEGAPLVAAVDVDARVVQVDRQLCVRATQRLIQPTSWGGQLAPVQAGVLVGRLLAVDQRAYGRHRQPSGADLAQPVAAQHRVGVLVAGGPHVGVVDVDRLVGRQAHQRPPGEVIERLLPAWEAALQLPGGVGVARLRDESLALQRVRLWAAPAGQVKRSARARGGSRGRGRRGRFSHIVPFWLGDGRRRPAPGMRGGGVFRRRPSAPIWRGRASSVLTSASRMTAPCNALSPADHRLRGSRL